MAGHHQSFSWDFRLLLLLALGRLSFGPSLVRSTPSRRRVDLARIACRDTGSLTSAEGSQSSIEVRNFWSFSIWAVVDSLDTRIPSGPGGSVCYTQLLAKYRPQGRNRPKGQGRLRGSLITIRVRTGLICWRDFLGMWASM